MPWAIVNIETLEIATVYSSDPDVQLEYHGDWGNPDLFTHVKIPDGYKSNLTLAQKDSDGVISIVENPNDNRNEIALQGLRNKRNALLAASDWRVSVPDYHTAEEQQAWIVYRQALRDFPINTTDPLNPEWPTPPN